MVANRDWANKPPDGFDWDPAKYAEALDRHRVRFEIAALVFDDPDRLERYDDRDDYGEDRFSVVGLAGGRVLRVAFTLRGEHDEITRIITGFAASPAERRAYERSRRH